MDISLYKSLSYIQVFSLNYQLCVITPKCISSSSTSLLNSQLIYLNFKFNILKLITNGSEMSWLNLCHLKLFLPEFPWYQENDIDNYPKYQAKTIQVSFHSIFSFHILIYQWFYQHTTNLLLFSIFSNYQSNRNHPNLWFRSLHYWTALYVSILSTFSPYYPFSRISSSNTKFFSDYIRVLLKSSNRFFHLLIIKSELLSYKTWFIVHLLIPYQLPTTICFIFLHNSHRHLLSASYA